MRTANGSRSSQVVAWTWAAAVMALSACDARTPPPIPEEAQAPEGPETWQVDRKTYPVAATYYELRPEEGGLVFTVQHECDRCEKSPGGLSREEAMKIAEPLFRYAAEQGRHLRAKIRTKEFPEGQPVGSIAVVLYETGWFRRSTNRVSRPVSQINSVP